MTVWDRLRAEPDALDVIERALKQSAYRKASQQGRPSIQQMAALKLLETFSRATPEEESDDAKIYPECRVAFICRKCGAMRSRNEGGTTFTVCDGCWDHEMPDSNN